MFSSTSNEEEYEPSSSSVQGLQPCRHFEFHEIQTATENFNESLVIGHGGFGKVYKGKVFNGSNLVEAAIKRLDSTSDQGAAEFWAEVETLSMLRHCNLVSLFGYCNHEREMILVYEYIPNGSLDDHLHKFGTPLSWVQRLKICIGAGRGLHYLHTGIGSVTGVIHRDVKSSNILLHESWEAKISDFGLSKLYPMNQQSSYVNTVVKGTVGYVDPDYLTTGRVSRKSDVYAFGVVLLEVLCRKRAVDSSVDEDQWGLATWAQERIKEGKLKHIIDFDLRGQISPKSLKEFVRVTERCLLSNPMQRPTMAEALSILESALMLQDKFTIPVHGAAKTIVGRIVNTLSHSFIRKNSGKTISGGIVDMIPFSFNGKNSDKSNSKLSRHCKTVDGIGNSSVKEVYEHSSSSVQGSQTFRHFEFHEIQTATENFNESLVIGHGGFGQVYKAKILNGSSLVEAAIKRKNSTSDQGAAEFWAEVETLSMLQHSNVVSLFGYCNYEREMVLVYEYISNGTLEDHLHKLRTPLSWIQRLEICIGAGRGLHYLHTGTRMKVGVIHRDVKSSNILLNESWDAKIADFGLSKIIPTNQPSTYVEKHVKGTFGYIDPDYHGNGMVTRKLDVYAFGVVLLEVLCRKRAVDSSLDKDQWGLALWVKERIKEGKLKQIIDSEITGQISPESLKVFVRVAQRCLHNNPKQRPTMAEALLSLDSALMLQVNFSIPLGGAVKTISGRIVDMMLGNISFEP